MRPLALAFLCLLIACGPAANDGPAADPEEDDTAHFRIGAIADCQYADRDPAGARLFRQSPGKLRDAVERLNQEDLAFVVHLGDFIDEDWESFETLAPIAAELVHPWRHVAGNHDYFVEDRRKPMVHEKLGMPARYYSFELGDWVFAVLDGNDLSYHGWPEGSPEHEESVRIHQERYASQPTWNGAIGEAQLAWLENLLGEADRRGRKVVVFSHFPVYPEDKHNLWNAEEIVDVIERYASVKAWFNGHNHAGHYGERNGIHYLTLHGMVDTEETAYALIDFYDDRLEVTGIGRQGDFVLPFAQE